MGIAGAQNRPILGRRTGPLTDDRQASRPTPRCGCDALAHMNPKPPVLSLLLGLAFVAALGYGFYRLIMAVVVTASTVSSDTGKAIVTAGATIFASVASVVLGKIWEQRTKIK